jgi:hypothetical protein
MPDSPLLTLRITDSMRTRFAAKHVRGGADDCWPWTAGLTGAGYGAFYADSRQVGAHVFAYTDTHGPVPHGMTVDHTCRNRACVNPAHLRTLTRGANVLASPFSNAGRNQRKTHCDRGHAFHGANLVLVPNGRNPDLPPWRKCRACTNDRKRARRAAGRAAA